MAKDQQNQETTQLGDVSGMNTSILPKSATREEPDYGGPAMWHFGADVGLLVLRLAVGLIVGAHGLQHIFGSFNGQGVTGFATFLGTKGFTNTTVLAYVTGWTEIVGGGLLVLGLITPIAAAGVLGVLANAVYVKYSGGLFGGMGFEYELTLAAAAFALLFASPGRLAMDVGRGYWRRSGTSGFVGLVLAAAATVLIFIFARQH